MSQVVGLLVALLLAGSRAWAADAGMPQTQALARCSWDHPGVNPYMGDVVGAVDRYRDIEPAVRERLKARMARREYDDLVAIRRDSIVGRGGYDYGNTISDMHFGTRQLCHTVTRASWSDAMEEMGLVYCEDGACILVPTVCRNVSRVTRSGVGPAAVAGPLAGGDPQLAEALPPIDWFGPAGAGPSQPALAGGGPVGAIGSGATATDATPFSVLAGPYLGGAATASNPTATNVGAPVAVGLPGVPLQALPSGTGDGAAPLAAVPEPATWTSLALGLAALAVAVRRRAQRH